MTLEEAQERIKVLETEAATKDTSIADSNTKITQLNTENAERRVLNNQHKKSLYAAKKVIGLNNIKVDYDSLGTDGLTLNKETGAVEGEVSYNPASSVAIGGGVPPTSAGAVEAMTLDTIKDMSRDDIAKNWEAVSNVMANQPTQ